MPRRHPIQWNMPRMILLGLLALLVANFAPGEAMAQGAPATIKGTVKDKESGELLDYANVLLAGTTRGTMSLGGGVFYFNGMAPGTYTVKVLYLGYAPMEQTVTVGAGEIKNLSFELETVIVETLQAFDVEGAEYMVSVKSSVNQHKVSGETFEKYAIDSVEDAISKTAGVVMRNGELFVRGGRSGEVSMQIDGVAVDNPLGNGSLQVSTLAVDNTTVTTGGLDAKYGNALSGVVNITTKEGGEKFGGGMRFLTDDFGRQDKTFTNYDRFEYGFGGPTPVRGLTYFLAGDMTFSDTENTSVADRPEYKVKLGNTTLFKFRGRQANAAKGSVKLGYTVSEDKKVTAEYSYSTSQNQFYAPNWSVKGYAARTIFMPEVIPLPNGEAWFATGRNIPVYYGPWYDNMLTNARSVMVIDSRNSSERRVALPVLEVRSATDNRIFTVVAQASFDGFRFPYGAYSTVAQDSSYTAFNAANNFIQSKNIGQVGKIVWRQNVTESTFYTVRLGLVAFDRRSDVGGKDPYQYNHGPIATPGLFSGRSNIYLGSTDYYSDPLSAYFVTNSDLASYTEEYSRTYSIGFELVSARWDGHLAEMGLGIRYNDLERFGLSQPAVMRKSRFTLNWSQGGNRNIFHTYNPESYLYLQDRWEYEGMVVNYGLRYDMFSPGTAATIESSNDNIDRNVTKYKTAMQPRIGFAFPITERDGFSFHYGRFVQFPNREFLFASQDPVGNQGTLGNPNLDPMTTVQYSAGIKHQFTDHTAGQFSLYSKDMYDLIASTQVTDQATGQTINRYINKAFASARGVEFSLDKRFSGYYEFSFAYTYSFADGVASDPAFGSNPEGLEFLPNQELPLDWDQRHTLNLRVLFAKPSVWSSSFSFSYGSGFPWTPFDRFAKKQDPLDENSMRLPATFKLDIQLERNINFYGKRLSLQLQGFNLINQDVVQDPPGGPGFSPRPINGASSGGRAYPTETGKYGASLLQDADGNGLDEFIPIVDPRVFGAHRLFRFGIGYYF